MKKVNTLIIGAGRSGTTSIYEYLAAHPEVNFSITKELHFFSIPDLYARGEQYFHSLFNESDKKIIATADTYLLMDTEAPARIKQYNPDMRLIIMLREPIARSYSNYNYSLNYGHEKKDIGLLKTIELEPTRLKSGDIAEKNNLCHCYASLYYKHISFWLNYFPKNQLLLLKLEDLKQQPELFYKNLCVQLAIGYVPFDQQGKDFNAASGAKNKWLQQLLLNRKHPLRKIISFVLRPFRKLVIQSGVIDKVYAANRKQVSIPPLSEEEYQQLQPYFEQDLTLLEKEFGITFKTKH